MRFEQLLSTFRASLSSFAQANDYAVFWQFFSQNLFFIIKYQ